MLQYGCSSEIASAIDAIAAAEELVESTAAKVQLIEANRLPSEPVAALILG